MNFFYKSTALICLCLMLAGSFSGCNSPAHISVSKDTPINTDNGNETNLLPNDNEIEEDKPQQKNFSIDEYSLGVYPYYKNVITSYRVKTINKSVKIDGKKTIMKDVIKLTVGFTNNDELPIAYLWSQKPPISVEVNNVTDISDYPKNIGSEHNVMYLMPGESIVYDFFFKPEDTEKVIYNGESSITFLPISEDSIIDNSNYDLNNIFLPSLGAKNYSNYMVHSSSEFEMNIDTGKVTLIKKPDIATSIDALRHQYYTLDARIMDAIRKNGHNFYNVTPAYTLRYDISSEKGMVDLLDDIDANISIVNNLVHSKNEYYALSDGQTVSYVPDINKLDVISDDNGASYDLSVESLPSQNALEHSQLDLENTKARLVCVDGYMNFILLSDENYEYIKPLGSNPDFGLSEHKLYSPVEFAQNLKQNFAKIKSASSGNTAEDIKPKILEKVSEILKLYDDDKADLASFAIPPDDISFSSDINDEDISIDISDNLSGAVASIPIYDDADELYTMLIVFSDCDDKLNADATTFIKGKSNSDGDGGISIYNKANLLNSINSTVRKYSSHDYNSEYFETLDPDVSFEELSSLADAKIVIDDKDITRAVVTLPINGKNDIYAQMRVRDIANQCRIVGVKFIYPEISK